MKNKYEIFRIKNSYIEKEMKEFQKNKIKNSTKKQINNIKSKNINISEKEPYIDTITFGQEIEKIKRDILIDINECYAKKEKDILILIDFNI